MLLFFPTTSNQSWWSRFFGFVLVPKKCVMTPRYCCPFMILGWLDERWVFQHVSLNVDFEIHRLNGQEMFLEPMVFSVGSGLESVEMVRSRNNDDAFICLRSVAFLVSVSKGSMNSFALKLLNHLLWNFCFFVVSWLLTWISLNKKQMESVSATKAQDDSKWCGNGWSCLCILQSPF